MSKPTFPESQVPPPKKQSTALKPSSLCSEVNWDWEGERSLANFRRNCQTLRIRAPELVEQLEACPFPAQNTTLSETVSAKAGSSSQDSLHQQNANEAEAIQALRSRDGNWILQFQGKPLYSRYRPLEECQKWIQRDLRKETNAAIFAGLGLGYQIEELLDHRSKALILVVECSYALFKAALCLRDLSSLLSNPQFFCSVGPAANLEQYLHHFSERNFQFYQLQSLYNCQHSFYQPLQRRILSLLNRFRINTNTLNRFGQLWAKNIAMNLGAVAESADAGLFYQRFADLPFLLIAAGPSLENLLPKLPELRQRFVLLAVDTALALLLQQGIEPDFVISVDPQLLNARHFDFCQAPKSILVAESCIYPLIFQLPWRFRALFHSNFPLMDRIERYLGGHRAEKHFAQVRSGGSVATAAWDFARSCKASQLYAAGLDLSYPTLRSHCPGTLSQSLSLLRSSRLQPVEHMNWRVTVSAGAQHVDSWQGPQIKTLSDKRMNVYRNWLEESLKNTNWRNYAIDGSGGRAAQIQGMELLNLEDALEQPERRSEIDVRLEQILQSYQAEADLAIRSKKLRKAIGDLLTEAENIYRWSAELLALLCYDRRNPRQKKRLQELQSEISQSSSRSIISFFFTDTLSQVVGRSPEQEEKGQWDRDRLQIYQRFYLSSKFHLYWLHCAKNQLR